MGYKDDLKKMTVCLRRLSGGASATESTTANRKLANDKKRKRMRQVAEAVKRWRNKHRAQYNAQMKAYQAKRRALVSVIA